jgi:pimeloyl-ACP methyl ester carboxylesterase
VKPRWLALAVAGASLLVLLFWPESPAGPTGRWLAQAAIEERFAVVDGLRVRYVRSGHGPVVVLIHGFASSLYTWSEVMDPLSRSHDVVALDLPGFGQSDLPPSLTADVLPRIVLGLMDGVGLAKATLIGHSMGGAVAAMIAARFPERVDRLVLLDAAGFDLARADRPWLLRVVGSEAGGVLARLPRKRLFVTLALRQVFYDRAKVTAERVDEYLAPLERPGAIDSMRSLLAPQGLQAFSPFVEVARRVRAPALVVWGRDDAWIPLADADRFVGALPVARKVVLERCGHVPQEERPAEVSHLLEAFLTEPAAGT